MRTFNKDDIAFDAGIDGDIAWLYLEMIVVRDTFQAKYGRGGELVALFKELRQQWPGQSVDRIFTDASGPFDTVVTEATVESVAAWQQRLAEIFPMPAFGDWFTRMRPLVESGRREFYNIEGYFPDEQGTRVTPVARWRPFKKRC